ncbi:hypothetical protein LIA77_11274 [Sarocladium implicatum]|nr:hypothetical protein LIA77_11274 [Sarocladium implicatum]
MDLLHNSLLFNRPINNNSLHPFYDNHHYDEPYHNHPHYNGPHYYDPHYNDHHYYKPFHRAPLCNNPLHHMDSMLALADSLSSTHGQDSRVYQDHKDRESARVVKVPKGPILSCPDVGCPHDGHNVACTLINDTFIGVGVVPVPSLLQSLSGISLIKAVGPAPLDRHESQKGVEKTSESSWGNSVTYNSVYYLGTPPSLDVSDLSGCTVVFHDTAEELSFDGVRETNNIEIDTGACKDVIRQDCIDPLQKIAEDAIKDSKSCQSLDRALRDTRVDSCKDFSGYGRGLGWYTVIDAKTISPITGTENSTSNCWPVLPKSSRLSHLASDEVTVIATPNGIQQEVHKITPILAVLRTDDMDTSFSRLVCTKMVTGSNAPGMSADNSACRSPSKLGLAIACIFALSAWA